MKFIKNNFAQAEGYGILVGVAIIIIVVAIVATNWDTFYQAYLHIKASTCISDPKWSSWNKC